MRLAGFAKAFPKEVISVEDCVAAAGHPAVEAKAFRRIFGIDEVRAFRQGFCLEDVLAGLLQELQSRLDGPISAPDTLIYVHACPLQAISAQGGLRTVTQQHPLLAQVREIYEMDQNCCATLFWALEAARNMIQNETARSVLIVAGDSFSDFPLQDRYMSGCTLIGDGFAALLVDGQSRGLQICDIVTHSNPDFHYGPYGTASEIQEFNRAQLRLTTRALDEIGFDPSSAEPILPHNINRFNWEQYGAAAGVARDRIWLNLLRHYGHCNTIDAALNLDRFANDPETPSAVMIGVGQGGFVGGCRVHKDAKERAHAAG